MPAQPPAPNCPSTHRKPKRSTPPGRVALKRLEVDFVALSETRLADKGELEGGGYCCLYSGRPAGEDQIHGVAIAIKTQLRKCIYPWKAVSPRIITAHIHLERQQFASVVSVYAPTLTSPDEAKTAFL